MPAVHRGPRRGPRRQGSHRAGARGLRPGLLLHLLHRCRRDAPPPPPRALGAGGQAGVRGVLREGRVSGADQCLCAPAVKYLNAYTGTVLLRCRKDFYRLLCSALPFVRQLESRAQRYPCSLNTLHVGGQPGPGGRPWCPAVPSRPARMEERHLTAGEAIAQLVARRPCLFLADLNKKRAAAVLC